MGGWLVRGLVCAAGAAVFAAAGGVVVPTAAAAGVTVTLTCFASPGFADSCRASAAAWEKRTGNTVRLHYQPEDTTTVLQIDHALLEAGSPDVDVFQVDVIWPGILARHFVDLRPYVSDDEIAAHFPQIIANNTVDGRLVAMPWYTDAGLLYFRKDLLESYGRRPPDTWAELAQTAEAIVDGERKRGNRTLSGFLWQGRAYEGLTCNALEWIDSFGGGAIVEADGTVSVDNPRAVAALETAAGWLGRITPRAVLFYGENESRDAFRAGDAVFLRNWPFAWAQLNAPDSPVAGRVGVTALPRGGNSGKRTGTLGGWQLAVSRHSRNVEAAVDLVRFMTGREEQKRRAVHWSYSPTIADLYRDAEVLAANPFLADLHATLVDAVARPSRRTGARYGEVSAAFWTAVHATLSGTGTAAANLADLGGALRRMEKSGW
ncbi:ABC transporter substrate-binding protein [Azospirillum halopraeferens]|uniref:ABC transporter substrate-binding protein n=1 Tax=Azospirillum halopraeferens TaxID=34010 RepID=UPI00042392C0|nr:ABC transporter substrate-binding protein [Azospirillum halopraeferens]